MENQIFQANRNDANPQKKVGFIYVGNQEENQDLIDLVETILKNEGYDFFHINFDELKRKETEDLKNLLHQVDSFIFDLPLEAQQVVDFFKNGVKTLEEANTCNFVFLTSKLYFKEENYLFDVKTIRKPFEMGNLIDALRKEEPQIKREREC